jgi:deoxyribonuclease V
MTLHGWNVSPREAVVLQEQLRASIVREDRFGTLATIAGVDVAYAQRGREALARAAAVLFDVATKEPLERVAVDVPVCFPYVPGLLTFREAPAAIAALDRLSRRPDMLMCDGQGLAHPRRMGFASLLGLFVDLPSIGVAKSRLTGRHAEPASQRGAVADLIDGKEVVGAALRTKDHVKPVYVSIGHRVCLATAIAMALEWSGRYRLPEPVRAADRLSKSRQPLSAARSPE